MRQREAERKVKKVLQHPNFDVEMYREDDIVRIRFKEFDFTAVSKMQDLIDAFQSGGGAVMAHKGQVFLDIYLDD